MVFMQGFILLNSVSASPLIWLLELSLESKTSDGTLGFCFNVGSKMFLAALVFSVWQFYCKYSHTLVRLFCLVYLTLEPKTRDMAYLLSSHCSWTQPKKADGKGGFRLLLSIETAKETGQFLCQRLWQADWLGSRQSGRGDFWDQHSCLLMCIWTRFP